MVGLLNTVLRARESDGYIYTARTLEKPNRAQGKDRWLNELGGQTSHDSHELYNHGHFIEALLAFENQSQEGKALAAARKTADLIGDVWGPDRLTLPPGHPGIESSLLALCERTGQRSFLETAHFLMECRGRGRHLRSRHRNGEYFLDHRPVRKQREPKGHAVRALYLYRAMTDYARLAGDEEYASAVRAI